MYNPDSVRQCDIEKQAVPASRKRVSRKLIDTMMTGVGLIASVSSVPQVLKILETKEVSGISLATQLLALAAVACWFLYGLYIKNKPLAITSFLTTIIVGTVVVQIFIYS